ncbi:MAG TPA: hypothetical protein VFH11_01330 [Gemmatimonadota bacterium]|nr:hypothetical protein [Gemmatimonadota bacterium]
MTNERDRARHPSDIELAAWVDEPGSGPDLSAHVEECARCRDKLAELTTIRAAIALDPPMPSDADLAAQRERILAAVEGAPREGGARIIRRIGWLVPLAAAAAIAAIVLVNRANQPAPGAGPAPEAVVAEAEAAAEEAAAIAVDQEGLDEALTAADPLTPAAPIQRAVAIETEFALLSEAEQSAILRELERTNFDL